MSIGVVILLICIILVLYTYLFYPKYVQSIASRSGRTLQKDLSQPQVSILMAAHNEETVISQKIESVLGSTYPLDKLAFFIGDDSSTDNTTTIIKSYASRHEQVRIVQPQQRMGKPAMINLLADMAISEYGDQQVFVLTDANVMFDTENISSLVEHTMVDGIGLVAGNVKFELDRSETNVATTENTYNESELKIKYAEGVKWGTMMGPFGACFSMRAGLWKEVPKNFIVDDFWTNMSVLRQGYKTVLAREALSYEKIVGSASVEYKRKVRMSMGNMQNLGYFRDMLFSRTRGLSYSYWSHKVLRWFTPFFLLIGYLDLWYIYTQNSELKWVLIVVHVVLLLCALDPLFEKMSWRTGPLRAVRHFMMMNIAMLQGYLQYWSGGARSIWEPTAREKKI